MHSQVDTIKLEHVTVSRAKVGLGVHTGVKSLSIDTLILKEKMALSLAELLLENSSVFIKTYGRGATATASLRGTGASHTNVYWNGIKINSPMSGAADFSLVPLYFIDDVAIHFGQSSMNFGSGGLGGSVNLSSSPTWNKDFGSRVYQSLGSYNTYSTAGFASYGKNHLKGQTRVFWEKSDNNFTYQNVAKLDRPIEVQQNADYTKYGALQELYFRPRPNSILSAKVWMQETSRGIPGLMSNYSNLDYNRQNDQTINSIIEWHKSNRELSWRVSTALSIWNLDYNFIKKSAQGNVLPVISGESNTLSWYNRANLDIELLSWLQADFNAELNVHRVKTFERILTNGYNVSQAHSNVRTRLMANPFERLSLVLLLAEDIYDEKLTPISSSFNFEYRLLKGKNLAAKGGVSRNYHHPSLNDLYWQPGGNPNLKPEDGFSVEGGLKYEFEHNKNKSSIDFSLFHSKISNWIMWLPHLKGYWEPVNLNLVNTRGAEVSVHLNQKIGFVRFTAIGSYSYTLSTIENPGGIMRPETIGMQLPFIPVHSGGLAVNTLWRKYHLIYTFTHFSERYTTTSNNPNSLRRLYPYYMSSAAISRDFVTHKTRMGLQLRVDNLLNESYQTILWRPMPGRNYSLVFRLEI